MSRVRYCAVASHNAHCTFPLMHGLINANCYSYIMDFHGFCPLFSLTILCICVLAIPHYTLQLSCRTPSHQVPSHLHVLDFFLMHVCVWVLARVRVGESESELELLASWMEELFAEPWTVYSWLHQ